MVVVPVSVAQGSGLGWYPTWYLMPDLQKLFFFVSTHFVIASFLRCCSSCCLIDDSTLLSEVVCAALIAESAWMMW